MSQAGLNASFPGLKTSDAGLNPVHAAFHPIDACLTCMHGVKTRIEDTQTRIDGVKSCIEGFWPHMGRLQLRGTAQDWQIRWTLHSVNLSGCDQIEPAHTLDQPLWLARSRIDSLHDEG